MMFVMRQNSYKSVCSPSDGVDPADKDRPPVYTSDCAWLKNGCLGKEGWCWNSWCGFLIISTEQHRPSQKRIWEFTFTYQFFKEIFMKVQIPSLALPCMFFRVLCGLITHTHLSCLSTSPWAIVSHTNSESQYAIMRVWVCTNTHTHMLLVRVKFIHACTLYIIHPCVGFFVDCGLWMLLHNAAPPVRPISA